MTKIIISIILFMVMLLFPILFSLFHLRKRCGKVLEIDQSKTKDPRYFVKSFTGLFDQKYADYDGSGDIFLSRNEKILLADELAEYPAICQSIIYAENLEFRPPAGIRFEKEVYARQSAYLSGIETIRAICSKKDLFLGNDTKILRWVDAEGILTVSNNCKLGISATSSTKIIIGNNCRFRRLYAPIIFFGQAFAEAKLLHNHLQEVNFETEALEPFGDLRYVKDTHANDDCILDGSIITTSNITVLNGLTVKGHIRSHKSIRLCDKAVVYGNLFAEGNIYLGENSRVYGTVFTQGDFYAERGVIIGQPGKTKSVIARGKMVFDQNCCVYGHVSSEAGGTCCPDILSKTANMLPAISPPVSLKSYVPKKYRPAVISAAMIFAVVTTGILATGILYEIQENQMLREVKQATAKRVSYGVDGKPGGGQLTVEPTSVTEEHVYFEDRVLERFNYDANDIRQSSEVIKGLMASLPEKTNKHLMLVPMRISFEGDNYRKYSDDINGAIAQVYSTVPSDVTKVDAVGALLRHKDEYLFFRTHDTWTAQGAYYAVEEFSKKAGFDMIPIKEYWEYSSNYGGNLGLLPGTESLKKYRDSISYYILEGAANEQTITVRLGSNDYRTYKSPTVALSRQGYDIFVGAYFSHSVLQGDAKNDKTLMILGDKYSKALAPWLTPYYENVILVDPKYFYGGSKEFWQLFSEYQITDFLVVQYAKSIGDTTYNSRVRRIYSKP